jgi:hypothetical protein
MAGPAGDFVAALAAFPGEAAGDLKALDALIVEATAQPASPELDRALFGIFERFPDEDGRGVYWGIVHGLEGRGGYEPALLDSIRRAPSPFALLMLNRIANAGQADCAGVSILALLEEVAASPQASPAARQEAADFLGEQGGATAHPLGPPPPRRK